MNGPTTSAGGYRAHDVAGDGGGFLSAFRLAARLARRETWRRPGRTLLAALLVAIPVAGMVVAATFMRTSHQSPAERWRGSWGESDAFSNWNPVGSGAATSGHAPDLTDVVPDGSRLLTYRTEYHRLLRTDDGRRRSADIADMPMTDPLAAPMLQVMAGRAPSAPDEVFLTRATAKALGAEVGDRLVLERPEGIEWEVVGLGERSSWWGSDLVVLGPGTQFAWRSEIVSMANHTTLIDLSRPPTMREIELLNNVDGGISFAPGIVPDNTPGSSISSADDKAKIAWSWVIGAAVLMVFGVVIAAAFAASARRQLVTLGQLAANGASPTTLRRVLFLQGTWTGVAGSFLGLVLAAGVLGAGAPHLDRILERDVDPYTIKPSDLLPAVLLGIIAATLAALVPALTTARIPVQAALAGRRPLRPVPKWLAPVGVAVGGGGLGLLGLAVVGAEGDSGGDVWVVTAIIGGAGVLLGSCAVAPGYVSVLDRVASRLRGASRLAARSLARQRTRTSAVVSAVCATSALAIAGSALLLAADAGEGTRRAWMRTDEVQLSATDMRVVAPTDEGFGYQRPEPSPVPGDLVHAVTEQLPGSRVHALTLALSPTLAGFNVDWAFAATESYRPPQTDTSEPFHPVISGFSQHALVADEDVLSLYDLPSAARRALETDGAVVLAWDAATGHVDASLEAQAIETGPDDDGIPPERRTVLAPFRVTIVPGDRLALGDLPRMWLSPERAEALGLNAAAGTQIVVRASAALTREQRDAIDDETETFRDAALDGIVPGEIVTSANTTYERPSAALPPYLVESLLATGAFLLSVFVVAVSLALAAAETRDERDVLDVVGAAPSTMRRTSGHKAWLLTALGGVLAIPVGFLPAAVFIGATGDDLPLLFPWRIVGLLVVVVPAMAALCTVAGTAVSMRLKPVRVSTMAFD